MKKVTVLFSLSMLFALIACGGGSNQGTQNETVMSDTVYQIQSGKVIHADTFGVGSEKLLVTLVGHGSFMLEYKGKIIHLDPYSQVADYSKLPKADLIILTHEHGDHLDTAAINAVKKQDTRFIVSKVCNEILGFGEVVNNGDTTSFGTVAIQAVPAYNIVHKKPDGEAYHPNGRGNGYIFTFGDKKVYAAADTENIPEMEALKGTIDIAFLPKNLPYTMTDEMFIDAAKKVSPKVLYPCHFSEFDAIKINKALEGSGIEVCVCPMKNN